MIYGYVRASTDSQTLSVDAQKEKANGYCVSKGLARVRFLEDEAVSSKIPLRDRVAGRELTTMIEAGEVTDVIIVKLDRAFRCTVECLTTLEEWRKAGVNAHILDIGVDTATPQGEFFLTVIAAFAQMERSLIGERTRTALRNAQKQGKRVGRVELIPYGKSPDAKGKKKNGKAIYMVENPYELKNLELMGLLRSDGMTYGKIANHLNDHGIQKRNGKAWAGQDVAGVMKRHNRACNV